MDELKVYSGKLKYNNICFDFVYVIIRNFD